jgi:THO complex subunit 2
MVHTQVPAEVAESLSSHLADVFWFKGLEIDAEDKDAKQELAKKQFICLVKACLVLHAAAPMRNRERSPVRHQQHAGRRMLTRAMPRFPSQRDGVVGADLLKARLEGDMLAEAGLIDDATEFHKKQVRVNTKDLYTTQKYNLLREESEGYSKLITELSELPVPHGESLSTRGCKNAAEVIANIQSLIG